MQALKYRKADFAVSESSSAIATFDPDQLPKAGVSAFHVEFIQDDPADTGFDASIISGPIVVKCNSKSIIDLTYDQLRAIIQRLSRSNRDSGTAPTEITIPAYTMDDKGNRRREACFEPGDLQVEIPVTTGADVAGTIRISWTLTDILPKWYTRMLRASLGVVSASVHTREELRRSFEGLARAVVIPTDGLVELDLRVAGKQLLESSGGSIIESERQELGQVSFIDPLCRKFDELLPAKNILSYWTTDSSFAGTEWVFVRLIPSGLANPAPASTPMTTGGKRR